MTDNVAAVAVDSYSFGISGYTDDCIEAFVNVTANNAEFTRTSDTDVQYRYTVSGSTVTPVLEEGQTYRVELAEDFEGCFVIGGRAAAAERARAVHHHRQERGGRAPAGHGS